MNLWIPAEDCLPHEVGEVEGVADEGHPAEEVGEAEHAQTGRHLDDGPKISKKESLSDGVTLTALYWLSVPMGSSTLALASPDNSAGVIEMGLLTLKSVSAAAPRREDSSKLTTLFCLPQPLDFCTKYPFIS